MSPFLPARRAMRHTPGPCRPRSGVSPVIAWAVLWVAGSAWAQAASTVAAEGASATAPPLAVAEFVHRVVVGNAGAQAARLQAQAAVKLVDAERALYDPTTFGRARRAGADRPRTFEEQTSGLTNVGKPSAVEYNDTLQAGLRGKLSTGATFELSHDLNRRASNLLQSADVREYRGTLALTFKQPLLRGYGRASTEADLHVAEKEQQIEQQRLVKQLLDLVGEAAGIWWRLYHVEQMLATRRAGVQTALELQGETRRRVEGGFAPRIDLLEAEFAIATRQTELARVEQLMVEVQARARSLLGADDDGRSMPSPRALASPPAWLQIDGLVTTLPTQALERWPSWEIARLRLEQEQLRLDFARRQERPDVSLELGLNRNSLTDRSQSALERSFGASHQGFQAGVVVEMPLDNGAARSRREAQALRRDAARAQLDAEARTVASEWATRRGQVQATRVELEQLHRELAAREALLTAERENHSVGRSRLRQLIEAQDRVDEGRLRMADAQLRARLADISYQTVAGTLLEAFEVRVASR